MEQHHESVLARDFVHQVHDYLVLVVGKIGLAVDGRKLELIGRHLVVAGLQRNAEAVSGYLDILHERRHPRRDGSEIVVVQLLVLGRIVSHQRAAGDHEVRTGGIERLVDEEVLLLPSEIGVDFADRRIEKPADGQGCIRNGLEGALERSLVVKGLARV